jgi:hypothetical protein
MLQPNNSSQSGFENTDTLIRELAPSSFVFEMVRALSSDACRDIVRRFEAAVDEQYPGRIGQMTKQDRMVKRSTDLLVSGKDHWKDVDRPLFHSLAVALRLVRESFGECLPVGRVGLPHELADAVLFLMTNTTLTGQVLDVDGGHMIRQYATR